MEVVWSRHARERMLERTLLYGTTQGDVEVCVIKQEVKVFQPNGTVKTVFCISERLFTVIKEETNKLICIISIWESNTKEVELWKKRK
jgi:hypothetical protein